MNESNEKPKTIEQSDRESIEAKFKILLVKPVEGRNALAEAFEALIEKHPDFESHHNSDYCIEGPIIDEDGNLCIQSVARTKSGGYKALRAVMLREPDETGSTVRWSSRSFDKDFPM